MRKLFYAGITLLCVTLLASCGKSGNSDKSTLEGKWQMKKELNEEKGTFKVTYDMELKADKTMAANIDVIMKGAEKGFTMQIPINLAFEGIWNTIDDKLELKADNTTTKLVIDKDKLEFKFEDPKMEQMGAVLKETLIASLESSTKDNMGKKFVPQEARPYKLEGNKLSMFMEKDTLIFERQ